MDPRYAPPGEDNSGPIILVIVGFIIIFYYMNLMGFKDTINQYIFPTSIPSTSTPSTAGITVDQETVDIADAVKKATDAQISADAKTQASAIADAVKKAKDAQILADATKETADIADAVKKARASMAAQQLRMTCPTGWTVYGDASSKCYKSDHGDSKYAKDGHFRCSMGTDASFGRCRCPTGWLQTSDGDCYKAGFGDGKYSSNAAYRCSILGRTKYQPCSVQA